jgi:threonine aldolase
MRCGSGAGRALPRLADGQVEAAPATAADLAGGSAGPLASPAHRTTPGIGVGTGPPKIAGEAGRPILDVMTIDRGGGIVDLRSDTVTHPTPAMRKAMYEAELGDDVFGDDPTVNALQERAAELLGKEAALFVASGSMANLVSQLAHLGRGQETIAGASTHIVDDEQAGHAVVVGTSVKQMVERPDGTWDLAELEAAFRDPADPHQPITGLVTIENTHAHSMAQPLSLDYTRKVAEIAHAHGVPLHIDGARFFNAAVALGITPRRLAEPADSIAFCLSKGLACPVGSMVVGSKEFIHKAWRGRKLVGGGMRQVGVLAAAGLVALSDGPDGMIARLAEDHLTARRLAEGLAAVDGIESAGGLAQPAPGPLDPSRATTNFVVFRVRRHRAAFLDALRSRGVLMVEYNNGTVRAVTHYGVTAADIDRVLAACAAALRETATAATPATPTSPVTSLER